MMTKKDSISLAVESFDRAYQMHLKGNIESAIKEYQTSIDIFPTAKAYTFLGSAYGLQGYFELAIEECKNAIKLEPEYSNPYNDIGTYLLNLGRDDEAIRWFEKALELKDQNVNHLSYFNLGKIFEKKGKWLKALSYFNDAILSNPDYEPAQDEIIRLSTLLN
ncbi:MAG: tetratricopeptide repeat protein [Bacteroidetes bacterium]|nr:tetratricopeptide repeat protein [Bacteroidota bacterium]